MIILLYLLGAAFVAVGGVGITLELLSISILASRKLSPLYQLFPGLSDWVTVPISLVTGIILISIGAAMMNKAWKEDDPRNK